MRCNAALTLAAVLAVSGLLAAADAAPRPVRLLAPPAAVATAAAAAQQQQQLPLQQQQQPRRQLGERAAAAAAQVGPVPYDARRLWGGVGSPYYNPYAVSSPFGGWGTGTDYPFERTYSPGYANGAYTFYSAVAGQPRFRDPMFGAPPQAPPPSTSWDGEW